MADSHKHGLLAALAKVLVPHLFGKRQKALFQAIFHYGFYNFLCNWIPQGMGNRAAADSKFGSDILFLPALKIKLDDLHMYRLKGLQGDVVSRGH